MEAEELVRRCVNYISENLDKDLTVEQIAEALNYSARHLGRVFLHYTGFTIGEYIRTAKAARAARALMQRLCVAEAAVACGYGTSSNLDHAFGGVYGVSPSRYFGAAGLPVIECFLPITVAGDVLRRVAAADEQTGLALWHGYDFSKVDPDDFNVASPEGGAEVGVWTEIDGEKCYLFGVCCQYDAEIPAGMVRCMLPAGRYAMFLVPEAENTHELSENIRAALEPALEQSAGLGNYEPVLGAPVMEYYHGKETYLCVPIREREA